MTAPTLAPEFRLLCVAARRDGLTRVTRLLRDAADALDWNKLIEAAYVHGVTGLLCKHLTAIGSPLVPEEVRYAASEHLRQQENANQRAAIQLSGILNMLRTQGIETIPFKGPLLALHSYGRLCLRSFRDLDILVRDSDREAAIEALKMIGYRQKDELSPRQWKEFFDYSGQDIMFGPGVPVEPHWAFAPGTLSFEIDYEALWQRADITFFNNAPVYRLAAEDELIMLCAHGSKEKWPKLKWVADVAALVDSHPALDWALIERGSNNQGLARMVVIGLQLAVLLLSLSLPPLAMQWLAREKRGQRLAQQLAGDFFSDKESFFSVYRISLFHLAMRERTIDKVRYLFRTITQPRIPHFESIALPDVLFPLYWPYKLMHDYIALPIWRLVKRTRRTLAQRKVGMLV